MHSRRPPLPFIFSRLINTFRTTESSFAISSRVFFRTSSFLSRHKSQAISQIVLTSFVAHTETLGLEPVSNQTIPYSSRIFDASFKAAQASSVVFGSARRLADGIDAVQLVVHIFAFIQLGFSKEPD